LLEGGVVEIYDPLVAACRFGLPATTRCKLCAAASEAVFDRAPSRPLREIAANRCPACLHELAASAVDDRRCPSCGARAELREIVAPAAFTTLADLERALDAWAERERFPSRHALAEATFTEPDIAKVFAAIQRQEPLEILADPFANMGMRATGGSARQKGAAPKPEPATSRTIPTAPSAPVRPVPPPAPPPAPRPVEMARAPAPVDASVPTAVQIEPSRMSTEPDGHGPTIPDPAYAPTEPLAPPISPPPPSAPPRVIVYPLVSVIAADGEIHPEERALVDRFLQSEGLAPLAEHEFCVHHPSEVAQFVPKERREDVVKLMCETAAIDGMPDESERRVIRAYATAWDVDEEKVEFWMWGYESMNTSLARQLFLKLRRFVLSARWSESEANER
jgi:uncharacterized tellurite resistance protein B-like protein